MQAALLWYGRLIDTYPRLIEAKRAKVLRAGVLVATGEGKEVEAESILSALLEDDDVAPESPVFHDALLALCELLYHQNRYGEAISRLGDFLTFYPDDEQRIRSRFMLADAYRRSAHAMLEVASGDGDAGEAAEGRRRLRIAAELFAELIRDADAMPEPADHARSVYTRLALFYRGDCLFELNEPDTLQAALKTYRNAAARYAGEPSALTAHVQIANIHLQQGDIVEAARALEKAHWLLRTIPEEAFARADAGTHEEWERFLSIAASSHLFREVFVGPP
jgi:tetratricopeptide (TPR) repeat protein